MSLSKKIFGLMLAVMVLCSGSPLWAQEPNPVNQKTGASKEQTPSAPDLAKIVPLATALNSRLADLENQIKDGPDLSDAKERYERIDADVEVSHRELNRLKETEDYRFNRLLEIKQAVEQENQAFEKTGMPISRAIHALGTWRKKWLKEKEQWQQWEASLLAEGEFVQLRSTFQQARDTIETALQRILRQLETLLAFQEEAGQIQVKLNALESAVAGLLTEIRRGALISASLPMLSFDYVSRLKTEIKTVLNHGFEPIAWPDRQRLVRNNGILLIQLLLSLFMVIAVYGNRRSLSESTRWSFMAKRPFSTGFFLGGMAIMLLQEYEGAPSLWKLMTMIIFVLSFARLAGALVDVSWKRASVYGLMTVLALFRLMEVFALPLPIFRLYMVLAALAGLLLCMRWGRESKTGDASRLWTLILQLAAAFFAVVIVLQLWGKASLGRFMFVSFMDSTATVLVFMLLLYMIHGGLEWLFRISFFTKAAHRFKRE